jgi:carbamoyltransferase
MITWGMSKNGHDNAIAVFVDSTLIATIAGKGKSHARASVYKAMAHGQPNLVVWYENPYLKAARQWIAGQPRPFKRNNIRTYLNALDIVCPWTYVGHHESHAAAYYNSSFSDATVVVIDSIGEFDCTTIWTASGSRMKKVHSTRYPHSIGLFYSAMTDRVGLKAQQDEGVFEALANRTSQHTKTECLVAMEKDFIKQYLPTPKFKVNFHHGVRDWGKQFTNGEIAHASRDILNLLLQTVLLKARFKTTSNNIVISGGVAFNKSVRPIASQDWGNVYIPPNPSDVGSAEGAVMAYMRNRNGR